MADELRYRHSTTGSTLYAVLRNWITGQVVVQADGSTEVQVNANWGTYDIPLAEDTPASGYFYQGDIPSSLAAGVYVGEVYVQAGGSPAITDAKIAVFNQFYWDGSYAYDDYEANKARPLTQNPTTKEYTERFVMLMQMNSNLVDNSGFLTVYDTTDTEVAQLPVTSDAEADPVTGVS